MAKEINAKLRKDMEKVIYEFFSKLDPSETNTNYYKAKFAKMSNADFLKFISADFPYRFHVDPFVVEPTTAEIKKAFDVIGIPMTEKVSLPHVYTDKDGNPVVSKDATIVYIHLKVMKQFETKKSKKTIDISKRDMKTGLLISDSKAAKETDKEFESLAILQLDDTFKELSTFRADAMQDKNLAYNIISVKGQVSLNELKGDPTDSLSKNMLNSQLLAAQLKSNIIDEDYHITTSEKKREVLRI